MESVIEIILRRLKKAGIITGGTAALIAASLASASNYPQPVVSQVVSTVEFINQAAQTDPGPMTTYAPRPNLEPIIVKLLSEDFAGAAELPSYTVVANPEVSLQVLDNRQMLLPNYGSETLPAFSSPSFEDSSLLVYLNPTATLTWEPYASPQVPKPPEVTLLPPTYANLSDVFPQISKAPEAVDPAALATTQAPQPISPEPVWIYLNDDNQASLLGVYSPAQLPIVQIDPIRWQPIMVYHRSLNALTGDLSKINQAIDRLQSAFELSFDRQEFQDFSDLLQKIYFEIIDTLSDPAKAAPLFVGEFVVAPLASLFFLGGKAIFLHFVSLIQAGKNKSQEKIAAGGGGGKPLPPPPDPAAQMLLQQASDVEHGLALVTENMRKLVLFMERTLPRGRVSDFSKGMREDPGRVQAMLEFGHALGIFAHEDVCFYKLASYLFPQAAPDLP